MNTGLAAATFCAGAAAGDSVVGKTAGALVEVALSTGVITAVAPFSGALVACGTAGALVAAGLCTGAPHAASTPIVASADIFKNLRLIIHVPPTSFTQGNGSMIRKIDYKSLNAGGASCYPRPSATTR